MGSNSGYYNTTGSSNIFLGQNTGQSNTNGGNNIFVGNSSGNLNTTGISNIFMGTQSGFNNISGQSNIFMGYNTGYNSNSYFNIFMGNQTGYTNTTGNNNIFIGVSSGYRNSTGVNNTLIGYKSGYNNTSNTNTYIGNLVGQLNNGNNNFFLGYELVDTTGGSQTTYSNKFAIYQNNNSGITSNSSGTCKILIGGDFSTGTVGIGTIEPDIFSSGSFHTSNVKLVVDGSVLANAYTSFTGAHEILLSADINTNYLIEGMIVSSNGKVKKIDINNTISIINLSNTLNDKTVFGVYSGFSQIPISTPTPAQTEIQTEIQTNYRYIYYANSVGEGQILITNIAGEVQNGDYITSSIIPGYGCLQSDDFLHSYTVAKCTETIDWDTISENILCTVNGKIYKSVMVACTYHCG